ncbi:MAG TPA: endonuclease NucS domain-containing protein, partial [Gemmataceae bacterium]
VAAVLANQAGLRDRLRTRNLITNYVPPRNPERRLPIAEINQVSLATNAQDRFGSRQGSKQAKANTVLTAVPKKMKQIMAEAGLDDTCYNHLNSLVKRGLVMKSEAGYALPSGTADELDGAHDGDQESSTEFAYEADLRNYLAKNLSLIEPGLTLYVDEASGVTGIEFPVGGRFIDILAASEKGDFVVVELKVSRGYDRVVGQLMRYMAWVRKNKVRAGQRVRGVIVAREISDDLLLACSELPRGVQLFEYAMSVALKPVLIQNGA